MSPSVKLRGHSAKPLRWLAWLTYAGILGVVFVVTAYFSFSFFVRSGVTAVPDLRGASITDAEALVRDQGLRIEWSEEARYDESVAANHVMRQEPRSGSLVKRGALVKATVSLGREVVIVPDVSERALQAAQVTLAAQGLSLGKVANVFSGGGRPGTVVTQDPPAGASVNRGRPVDLYLNLDNRASVFVMPDLVYRGYAEVRRYFERRDMRLGSVKFESYEGISPGIILRQHPLPGHPLRKSDVISLVVTHEELES
ncbi:MAG: PASTA domain-containing protein [bacterium]|nr:PASTA domain-containing protein [bacterium]